MAKITVDGNQATALIAYKLSQVIPVYPITPSTTMAEFCSANASKEQKNIWNDDVSVVELQSEGGVAGTLHGALLGGALSSTFTCSQGLLLMMPNMFKIAGENLPAVIHCSARTISSHALSIFGDHSDVMAVRSTGFSMICSANVQECHDMALISHVLAMKNSLPVLHFFDGFRTSHEIQKIEELSNSKIKKILPKIENLDFKRRALCPNNPQVFGTAQNPDVFFQNKIASYANFKNFNNSIKELFNEFENLTGRKYAEFEYFGNINAKKVIVSMASSTETIKETLSAQKIEDCGLIKVRVYRPFNEQSFMNALPKSVQKICVLDKTQEFDNSPLFQDVSTAIIKNNKNIEVINGIYGLGGKEFSPSDVMAVIENLNKIISKKGFSVGICDDVLGSSLKSFPTLNHSQQYQLKVFGLGSDGSVSASKTLIKMVGKNDKNFVQGFFEYDSKKAGGTTISHLRISQDEILSTYLVKAPDLISINNFSFVHKLECLEGLTNNGTVILNSIFNKDEIKNILPEKFVKDLKSKNAKLLIINASKIARENDLKQKINYIMLATILKIGNFMSEKQIISELEKEIKETFSTLSNEIVSNNLSAIKNCLSCIENVDINSLNFAKVSENISKNINPVMKKILKMQGDSLPVSAFSSNGSIETDTAKCEKRGISFILPEWNMENCIQCGQCVISCPHGALKAILLDENNVEVKSDFANAIGKTGYKYRIQLSPKDCTGCGVCQNVCPALKKAITLALAENVNQDENYEKYFNIKSEQAFSTDVAKGLQFMPSYFAFSGACAGCGETPYIKLASTLFGEKMTIANATGCSSIYCGSFPSCPFSKNEKGEGPAWANSLFEDNAEFGYGISLAKKYSSSPEKSVWIIGGDGWACDIGFSGLDHILQTDENVNILVLDNENYSNTGGQASKSTQTGAIAKFCENGKSGKKKDLGLIAMSYQNCYVASVCLGANQNQCIKAFKEAEAFNGPSLIIAYSPCISHGYDMSTTMQRMKEAVKTGYVNLYRYNPKTFGLSLDFESTTSTKDFMEKERRFSSNQNKERKKTLFEKNAEVNSNKLKLLKHLSTFKKD